MLSAIFDGTPLDTGFVQNLHALTEGNPFFVEEVLKALVGAGELTRRANGSWHARPLTSVQAPRTAVEGFGADCPACRSLRATWRRWPLSRVVASTSACCRHSPAAMN